MKKFLNSVAFVSSFGLSACGSVVPSVITEPPQVQSACTMISLAVPAAEIFKSQLGPTEQAILASAETALSDCASGNATAAILDVAVAIENLLMKRGVTKAVLLRRAIRH